MDAKRGQRGTNARASRPLNQAGKPGVCPDRPKGAQYATEPSALYDELLAGWRRLALQVTTQAQVRTEVVWFNFAPDRVHWASFAGRNFTERQSIKRKAANWGRRYEAMPAGERLAVLAAIMAVEADEGS